MNRFISEKMSRIRHSGIKRVLDKANQLEASGREIIYLLIGRPDFDTPSLIKQAAKQALDDGHVHYTPVLGIEELRQAIALDLRDRLGVHADPEKEIMVTAGSTGAIMAALMTILDPGDEIAIPDPMYLFYPDWGEFFGAKSRVFPLTAEEGYQISRSALERCLTPKTKAVFINSPHNPTGSVLNRESLEIVAQVAQEKDLMVISDEIYDMIVFSPSKHISIASLDGMRERTLLANSFSKGFAMDGWRIGYLVGPAALVEEITKAQLRTIVTATSFVQYGAVAALKHMDELFQPMMEEYRKRRDFVLDLIDSAPNLSCTPPQGTFYTWMEIRTQRDMDSWALADFLLEEAGVAVTPGEVFSPNARKFVRISFCSPMKQIEEGLTGISKALSRLG